MQKSTAKYAEDGKKKGRRHYACDLFTPNHSCPDSQTLLLRVCARKPAIGHHSEVKQIYFAVPVKRLKIRIDLSNSPAT